MRGALQRCLIRAYHVAQSAGLLSTQWGDRVFRSAYGGYKRLFEAGHLGPLQGLIAPGTSVIDVGANVGFFTLKFARWVSEGGKVIAIEPEPLNYARLRRAIASAGLDHVVETVQAAAAEKSGEVKLLVNPVHPGDHRISETGAPVVAVTIDDLLAARNWPRVSLIKIDVQGAESRVLAGASKTLQSFHPALLVEVCDEALRLLGSSAKELLTYLSRLGYSPHLVSRAGISEPMSLAGVIEYQLHKRYADYIFLHKGQ